jgi:hypothetical protein
MTDLRRTSFPAWEKNFSFHPFIRFQILPFMPLKVEILDLPIRAGKPRYFSYFAVELRPVPFRIKILSSIRVLWLKNRDVFARFSCCPEAALYCPRTRCIWSHSLKFARQNRRLSSAKRRWLIRIPPLEMGMPVIEPSHAECCIIVDIASAHKIKK